MEGVTRKVKGQVFNREMLVSCQNEFIYIEECFVLKLHFIFIFSIFLIFFLYLCGYTNQIFLYLCGFKNQIYYIIKFSILLIFSF
jgi:hypothetical protein